jgi:hypothetical protein
MHRLNLKIVRHCEAEGQVFEMELVRFPLVLNSSWGPAGLRDKVRAYLLRVAAELEDESVEIVECTPEYCEAQQTGAGERSEADE